jgi:hypothetical protein
MLLSYAISICCFFNVECNWNNFVGGVECCQINLGLQCHDCDVSISSILGAKN